MFDLTNALRNNLPFVVPKRFARIVSDVCGKTFLKWYGNGGEPRICQIAVNVKSRGAVPRQRRRSRSQFWCRGGKPEYLEENLWSQIEMTNLGLRADPGSQSRVVGVRTASDNRYTNLTPPPCGPIHCLGVLLSRIWFSESTSTSCDFEVGLDTPQLHQILIPIKLLTLQKKPKLLFL